MSKLIYIADDEDEIRDLVEMFLVSEGYEVESFATGDKLYEAYNKKSCDLVILDIMMPGTDGLNICNKLRSESSVPIILLTAKDSDADYIAGITLGSDDYLTKPFLPTILMMRVKALLRRVALDQKQENTEDIKCRDITISKKRHCILVGDKELNLTSMEMSCLSYLVTHYNEAVSRETLLNEVWGYDVAVETRVTDETIRRIRKKLKASGSSKIIKSKWGFGYMLTENRDSV